ncbi:DUF1302 domain-containing protein [Cupriavidus necator]|uniref:DUF1302 domain-containing protein n=1 Tax=Cupriavidus necator TaxID=106590 RepID=A0A1U9UP30_CUPNE|nr:DUF1302 domain-containing protein [Cupriavidus necator]AQV94422.1 DUF1302 domain-containing protein [Cupriavidus necator]
MGISKKHLFWGAITTAAVHLGAARAVEIKGETVYGSFDSQITTGLAMRAHQVDCQRVGDPNASGCGGNVNTGQFSNQDNGDLNYRKGDLFAAYVKGTHELLLNFPEDIKFMARGTWLLDAAASHTARSDLTSDARDQVARDVRLLDLWVSKGFNIGDQSARVRLGNQVINWGESIFGLGGINSTNALDIQKLLVPGTQLKEAVLPAPMLSFATGLGNGLNMEAYYQFQWNSSRLPPVGTYFSTTDNLGRGMEPFNISTTNPNFTGTDATAIARSRNQGTIQQVQQGINQGLFAGPPYNTFGVPFENNGSARSQGQYGLAFHYKPPGTQLDLGAYVMNYHDKLPVLGVRANDTLHLDYLNDRKLYGISANFPVGEWAVGWELSYRPHDAVALTACYGPNGPLDLISNGTTGVDCQQWIDRKRFQMHLTGLLAITPSSSTGFLLRGLGADAGTFTNELVAIYFPGVNSNSRYFRTAGGTTVMQAPAAGLVPWADNSTTGTLGYPVTAAKGTSLSMGYTADFNWTYDGTLIPGWQVTPGVTFSWSFMGYTPTGMANYMQGAKSANLYVLFNQNPTKWQAGLNYTLYWGANPLAQPLGDRSFVGAFLTRNF